MKNPPKGGFFLVTAAGSILFVIPSNPKGGGEGRKRFTTAKLVIQ
jgi:hypothetical protein